MAEGPPRRPHGALAFACVVASALACGDPGAQRGDVAATADTSDTSAAPDVPVVVTTACGAELVDASAVPLDIAFAPCAPGSGLPLECATVTVPLDWNAPGGRAIAVHVTRQLAAVQPARAQLWVLPGGPGEPFALGAPYLLVSQGGLTDVDLYAADFRGAGRSTPLACPELAAVFGWIEVADAPAAAACATALESEWGAGLAHFSTTQAARDIVEISRRTRASGQELILVGLSYGTISAQRIMHLEPAVTAVVLDSPVPLSVSWPRYFGDFDEVVERFFHHCASDEVCSAKLGADPWATFRGVVDAVAAGHCPTARGLDLRHYHRLFAELSLAAPALWYLAPLVHRVGRCEPADEAAILHAVDAFAAFDQRELGINPALHLNIVCGELISDDEVSVTAWTALEAASVISLRESAAYVAICDAWPAAPADAFAGCYPETDAPVLILSGALDVRAHATDVAEVAAHYDGAGQTLVEAPYLGHLATTAPCVRDELLAGFLAAPGSALATDCLDTLAPRPFTFTAAEADALFGTSDMWDDP